MKKLLSLVLALALSLSLFASCGDPAETTASSTSASTSASTTESTAGSTTEATSATTTESTTASETSATTETTTDNKPNIDNCNHDYKETEKKAPGYLQDEETVFTCSLCGATRSEFGAKGIYSIKILGIGNSFSVDTMEYLWDICIDAGFEEVILGNLYIGGCTLDTHSENIKSDAAAYTFYYNDDGAWEANKKHTLSAALKAEDWDFITLQQGSPDSGMPNSYGKLQEILDYLLANKTNKDAKILWHMTWAYQGNSSHSSFPNYNKDQMTMYNAIRKTVEDVVLKANGIDGVIPTGVAVQNLRTSYFGDTVTRDGYHLAYDFGRYLGGLTWFAYLTGASLDLVDETPSRFFRTIYTHVPVLKEAAAAAVANPDAITTCTAAQRDFKVEPRALTKAESAKLVSLGYDPAKYLALDTEMAIFSQYTMNGQITYMMNNDALTKPVLSHCTRIFDKDEIPTGSLIVIEDGYRYNLNGWKELGKAVGKAPKVTATLTVVDDAWWGEMNYRAMDIESATGADFTREDAAKFMIFVPKQ